MATDTATLIRDDLDLRFETSIVEAFERVVRVPAHRVTVEEQERHTDRMVSCHFTLMGQGWFGSLILLVPQVGAHWLASTLKGMRPGETLRGPDVADALGTIGAAIAIQFGASFEPDAHLLVGLPSVITGTDVAVSFPWGNHFESRMCFKSAATPFWAILRLCRRNIGESIG
jgi:hypothetical protein